MPVKFKFVLICFLLLSAFLAGSSVTKWRMDKIVSEMESTAFQLRLENVAHARQIESQASRLEVAYSNAYSTVKKESADTQQVIVEKVIEYVEIDSSGQCDLSNGWVRLDTAAAKGMPPDDVASIGPDDAPSGFTDIDLLQVNTRRSQLCREEAEKLELLQKFVRDQYRLFNLANSPPENTT